MYTCDTFFPTEDCPQDCPQTEVVSNLAHKHIHCSPDTISLSHSSEYTADDSWSSLHHSCVRTDSFELALGSTHPPSGRGQQEYVPMLITAAGTSYHTPSVILMPGLTLNLWPALFLWKYSGHSLSLSHAAYSIYLIYLSASLTLAVLPDFSLLCSINGSGSFHSIPLFRAVGP